MNSHASSSIPAGGTAPLSQRIAALRADIAGAREKARRLQLSIATREKTLHRLQSHLVLHGEHGAARPGHG